MFLSFFSFDFNAIHQKFLTFSANPFSSLALSGDFVETLLVIVLKIESLFIFETRNLDEFLSNQFNLWALECS